MKRRQFIDALVCAGWRNTLDAQHENIEALWKQLFPEQHRIEKLEYLVDNVCEVAEDMSEDADDSCLKIAGMISDSDI